MDRVRILALHTLETTFGDACESTHLSTVFLLVTPKSVGKSNGEHHNVIPSPRGPAKKNNFKLCVCSSISTPHDRLNHSQETRNCLTTSLCKTTPNMPQTLLCIDIV
jgi:hypothetical protein